MTRRIASVVAVAILFAACGGDDTEADVLSSWGLFVDAPLQVPADGVVPYDVIAALFMDHSTKHRFVQVPEGATIAYSDDGIWAMPEGTVLVKSFGYLADARDPSLGEHLVETRLLVNEVGIWTPYVYLWNEEQTEATRLRGGARRDVAWIDGTGASQTLSYRIPNESQCIGCHGGVTPVHPLGPKTLQLDRAHDYGAGPVNQIDHIASVGLFDVTPTDAASRAHFEDPFGTGDVDARARAYLDANCAHCHREGGSAMSSGLWLGEHITDPASLGVCRRPVAAGAGTGGLDYDIVPGDPDASIMVFRMESEEPDIKMPELPSQLSDADGVAVIREWIAAMPPTGCE